MQDAGIEQITNSPEAYARYLDMQGDNPTYSVGNIALVMLVLPQATVFGTRALDGGDVPDFGGGGVSSPHRRPPLALRWPQATVFGTRDRWRALNRSVMGEEMNNSVKIFAKGPMGRGYVLAAGFPAPA